MNLNSTEGDRLSVSRGYQKRMGRTLQLNSSKPQLLPAFHCIINSHRGGKQKKRPRQIIARLKSVDTKFFILRNSAKFRKHEHTKRIAVNEDLTKYRDRLLFLCRQLCHEQKLKNARSTNGKITVKDRQDRVHHIRDERDLTKFGHEIKDTY
jgi:hypothetical protein